MQWMGMMMVCCRMAVKGMGMLVSVRKMKVLTVKLETVTLISKIDRIRHPLCTKCMNLVVKYTFLVDILSFWRSSQKYIFLWKTNFIHGLS